MLSYTTAIADGQMFCLWILDIYT